MAEGVAGEITVEHLHLFLTAFARGVGEGHLHELLAQRHRKCRPGAPARHPYPLHETEFMQALGQHGGHEHGDAAAHGASGVLELGQPLMGKMLGVLGLPDDLAAGPPGAVDHGLDEVGAAQAFGDVLDLVMRELSLELGLDVELEHPALQRLRTLLAFLLHLLDELLEVADLLVLLGELEHCSWVMSSCRRFSSSARAAARRRSSSMSSSCWRWRNTSAWQDRPSSRAWARRVFSSCSTKRFLNTSISSAIWLRTQVSASETSFCVLSSASRVAVPLSPVSPARWPVAGFP